MNHLDQALRREQVDRDIRAADLLRELRELEASAEDGELRAGIRALLRRYGEKSGA